MQRGRAVRAPNQKVTGEQRFRLVWMHSSAYYYQPQNKRAAPTPLMAAHAGTHGQVPSPITTTSAFHSKDSDQEAALSQFRWALCVALTSCRHACFHFEEHAAPGDAAATAASAATVVDGDAAVLAADGNQLPPSNAMEQTK